MLSLNDFKKFKINVKNDILDSIKGGISCEEFWRVMDWLDKHSPDQAKAIRDYWEPRGWIGFQCD